MYLIKFVIGDWSGDGHSISETYVVQSTVSVKELREIQFKSIDFLGFDVGCICSDYGEDWITRDFYEELGKLLKWESDPEINEEFWNEYDDKYHFQDSKEILQIWLDCLMLTQPGIQLTVVDDDVPSLHFYGRDEKGRHLNTPGYGLFE